MPLATDEQVAAFISSRGPMRIACRTCFTDEADGVAEIPPGWNDVGEVQDLRDSLSVYDDEEKPKGYCVLDWFTHLGNCPRCSDE